MKKSAAKPGSSPLSVGSRVKLVFGVGEVTATIVEDRGNVGHGGRRLLRVQLDVEGAADPIELEIPEAELTPIAA